MRSSSLSVIAVVAASLAACAGDDGHDHDHDLPVDAAAAGDGAGDAAVAPRETVNRQISLGPGASAEAELALVAAGDRAHVRVTAGAATLAWNLHTHQAGQTQVLAEGNAVSFIDHVIDGPVGPYWLLLVNGAGTLEVTVNLELYGQAQYTGGL